MSMSKKQRREYKAAVAARRSADKAFKLAREAESRAINAAARNADASNPPPAAATLP